MTDEMNAEADVDTVNNELKPPLYECEACGDEFLLETGVVTCAASFMCEHCVLREAQVALSDLECCPLQCCNVHVLFLNRLLEDFAVCGVQTV